MASEQTTIPEPPDRHAVLWPTRQVGDWPVVVVRDDRLAAEWGDPPGGVRWFEANVDADPLTWDELREHAAGEGYPLDEAVVLAPAPEMVGDHPRELGGYCRRCGEPHSEPEWQRIADRAAEGGQSGG